MPIAALILLCAILAIDIDFGWEDLHISLDHQHNARTFDVYLRHPDSAQALVGLAVTWPRIGKYRDHGVSQVLGIGGPVLSSMKRLCVEDEMPKDRHWPSLAYVSRFLVDTCKFKGQEQACCKVNTRRAATGE